LNQLPNIARELVQHLTLQNKSGEATEFVKALSRQHAANFNDPRAFVSLHLKRSETFIAWQRETKTKIQQQTTAKQRLDFPRLTRDNRKDQIAFIEDIFKTNDPQMKDDLIVAEIAKEGPMQGQLQIKFTQDLVAGTLIPWFGNVYHKSDDTGKAFLYERQDRSTNTLVMAPAPPTNGNNAACCFYTNDYAGPFPERKQNKKKNKKMLNLEMVDVKDYFGTPYFFFMTKRDVKKGEVGWTDYGDDYWKYFEQDLNGLSQTSHSCLSISNILALVEGRSTNNPIDVSQ
jgi:hypothetical protein